MTQDRPKDFIDVWLDSLWLAAALQRIVDNQKKLSGIRRFMAVMPTIDLATELPRD